MEGFNEFLLIAAAAAPVATIVVTNLVLMAAGERGTLLLPDLGSLGR
jgi:hypothetical protein